jgi:NADH-quinone oxidoreductase subunit J
MEAIAFLVLTVLAISSAMVVITHRNQVICALALAFNLLSIAGFYFLLGAQFIGFLQIIVYAGAIMVLILFVVMLLNLGQSEEAMTGRRIQRWLAPVVTIFLALILFFAIRRGPQEGFQAEVEEFGTVAEVGRELFGRFFYPFEVISLLIVAAMVGAVLLAKRRL